MRRRVFVKGMLAAGGSLACRPVDLLAIPTHFPEVRRVLVIFKCHLDIGFTDTQAGVMRRYFDQYFPKAL